MLCNTSTLITCTAHALAYVHTSLVPTGASNGGVHIDYTKNDGIRAVEGRQETQKQFWHVNL